MTWDIIEALNNFQKNNQIMLLTDGNWGIEKEGQRVTLDGKLALSEHPAEFGDKQANPNITVDFSESQLELVTATYKTAEHAWVALLLLQRQANQVLNTRYEYLWPLSMPPELPEEEYIPIARFAATARGREAEIYRRGLAERYGKKMQMISGIHYNYSLGDRLISYLNKLLKTDKETLYCALARNFLRHRWLLVYLFGASPEADESYNSVICDELKRIKQEKPDCYEEISCLRKHATSLRVSRYGYSNVIEQNYSVSFDSLDQHIKDLSNLLDTKSERFANIGIYRGEQQIQLNENILQKENEFYSSIRLKGYSMPDMTALDALKTKGISHVEVRILDLNPYELAGVSLQQMYFMHTFLLMCLLDGAGPLTTAEVELANQKHHLIAMAGRKNFSNYIQEAEEVFSKLYHVAQTLDIASNGSRYTSVVHDEQLKLTESIRLPAVRMQLDRARNDWSYINFGMQQIKKINGGY